MAGKDTLAAGADNYCAPVEMSELTSIIAESLYPETGHRVAVKSALTTEGCLTDDALRLVIIVFSLLTDVLTLVKTYRMSTEKVLAKQLSFI